MNMTFQGILMSLFQAKQQWSRMSSCAKPAMRPETRNALLAAIAKARGWIDDMRLGRIVSFAEIAEREALHFEDSRRRDYTRSAGGWVDVLSAP
jgi:hypothetical protein